MAFFPVRQLAKIPQNLKPTVWKKIDKLVKFSLIILGLLAKKINLFNKDEHSQMIRKHPHH